MEEINVHRSSAIVRAVYDPWNLKLWVRYRNNKSKVVYCYDQVPVDLAQSLASTPSAGRAISVLKKKRDFAKFYRFPDELPSDFTQEWLIAIDNHRNNLDYCNETLATLSRLSEIEQRASPSFPPKKESGATKNHENENSHTDHRGAQSHSTLINPYASLNYSSEEEAVAITVKNEPAESPGNRNKSIQVRYLRIRLLVAIVDLLRARAFEKVHQRNWSDVVFFFTEACNVFNVLLNPPSTLEVDRWLAILVDAKINFPDEDILMDGHHKPDLIESLDSLSITREHTIERKNKSIIELKKRASYLQKKLAPMHAERNHIRDDVVGKDEWTNNPEPKLTYAERRRAFEEELMTVRAAISALMVLELRTL
jgi:hypothetical protein